MLLAENASSVLTHSVLKSYLLDKFDVHNFVGPVWKTSLLFSSIGQPF